MPTVLYRWDFETGDTQGWILESYVTLDNTSAVQETYSLYTSGARVGGIGSGESRRLIYIQNIDLSSAVKPFLIFLVRARETTGNYCFSGIRVVVKDSGGNTLLDRVQYVYSYKTYDVIRVTVFDLSPVAGISGLTIEIYWYAYGGSITNSESTKINIDNIYIIDGGDKEYNIAVLSINQTDRTFIYSIPESDRPLPSGVAKFSIALATPPHPLSESTDIFIYTVYCDQGSAYIDSTEFNIDYRTRHLSVIASPSTPPSYINELNVRIYPKTANTTWYSFDEKVVVTFWSTAWNLVYVVVFNVAITINPYSPTYVSAMINTTYGSTWSGQREFTVKVHAHSFSTRLSIRFVVGSSSDVSSGYIKLEVFNEDYSVKYGESSIDLTTGATSGSVISDLPVDTTLKFRISWSFSCVSSVTIESRPVFIVD